MANEDQSVEYPKIRYNLIRNRMEFFRAGIQWTAVPVIPGQIQPLEEGHLLIGDSSNTGMPVEVHGGGILDSTGLLTITNPVTVYDTNVEPALTAGGVYVALAKVGVTLPAAASVPGELFYFNGKQSSDFNATPVGAETIDGVAGTLAMAGSNVTLVSDGNNWYSL